MVEENSRENIEKNGGELILTKQPFPLTNGLISTGEIEQKVDFEEEITLETYTTDHDGKMHKDKVVDDMSLIMRLPEGIVVISGCSHAGIVSIVKRAKEITGDSRVKAVIGGFHLFDADKKKVDKTLKELETMKVDRMYAGHCTGFKAECEILKRWEDRFEKLHSGKIIEF
jgi:7,8-dihydropterin-6-yl-methyl-4-(beta-D-ribofuranosyl)aminobenzene 5'-phosphate synthase